MRERNFEKQTSDVSMDCILCRNSNCEMFRVKNKPECDYFHCRCCDLIFMNPDLRLTPEQEKARYDFHKYDEDPEYAKFFEPLIQQLNIYLPELKKENTAIEVLDYGSGPAMTLGKILAQQGFKVSNYDHYYFTDQQVLKKEYDIITSTEVWEHLYNPHEVILKLIKLLKPGGLLGVMTSAHFGVNEFHQWYYRRDMTHVTFYSEKTMQWIANFFTNENQLNFQMDLKVSQSPLWLFKRVK